MNLPLIQVILEENKLTYNVTLICLTAYTRVIQKDYRVHHGRVQRNEEILTYKAIYLQINPKCSNLFNNIMPPIRVLQDPNIHKYPGSMNYRATVNIFQFNLNKMSILINFYNQKIFSLCVISVALLPKYGFSTCMIAILKIQNDLKIN